MKISKNQLKQIIQEELAAALDGAPERSQWEQQPFMNPEQAERYQAMTRNLESEYIINATSRDEEELKAIEWAKTAVPWDGHPRWADPLYTQAFDNRRQHALDNISNRDDATRPIRAEPRRAIDSTLEMDGKVPPTPQTRQLRKMEEQSAYGDAIGQEGGHGGDTNLVNLNSVTSSKESSDGDRYTDEVTAKTRSDASDYTLKDRQASRFATGEEPSYEETLEYVGAGGEKGSSIARSRGDTKHSEVTGKVLPSGDVGFTKGREASITRMDPLGMQGVKQTLATTKVDGVELKPGDKGYLAAQAKLRYPGVPEAGETGEERNFVKTADASALDETFKRWKKLING